MLPGRRTKTASAKRSAICRWRALRFVFAVFLICNSQTTAAAEKPTLIAAAASLRFAMDELVSTFKKETGHSVTVSFGSSGNIARQIQRGAPFELFLSADERHVAEIVGAGLALNAGRIYATGRLVLFAPTGSPLTVDAKLEGLRRLIDAGALRRFAIANPVHAPYGRAAREVLRHNGLWDMIQKMIIYGENISQTAQFATSGSVDGGLLSYSLVKLSAFQGNGNYVLVPPSQYAPIHHRMVLMKQAGKVARTFFAFMMSAEARKILSRHGLTPPENK